MQGLILAAGKGTRMGNIEMPKCLLEINGIPIIKHQINSFKKNGIEDILVVTGYKSEMIHNLMKNQIRYIHNARFNEMNNIYSMWLAIKELQEDFICVYGDLMFDKEILRKCLGIQSDIGIMIETNTRDETMKVRIENNKIVEVNKKIKKEHAAGNFIGMAKFSKNASKKLFYEIDNLIKGEKDGYYTTGIENLIKKKLEVGYQTTDNLLWMDIDDEIEFKESHKIFRGTGDF